MGDYKKKDQEKALSIHSPSVHPEHDAPTTGTTPSKFHVSYRHIICFCACCTGTTAILGLVIVILSFTVFKVRDPTLELNSIKVDDFRINISTSEPNFVSANVTLVSDISIKNPNMVTFNFDRTVTEFYYRSDMLGVAYAPAGRLGAQKATRLNLTMDVLANRIVQNGNVTAQVLSDGELGLTSYTSVKGRASVLGFNKRNLEVGLNCSIVLGVSIFAAEIKSTACIAAV